MSSSDFLFPLQDVLLQLQPPTSHPLPSDQLRHAAYHRQDQPHEKLHMRVSMVQTRPGRTHHHRLAHELLLR